MPWNQPGGNKDPWSNGPKKTGSSGLDNILKKVAGGGGGSASGGGSNMLGNLKYWPLILIALWLLSGIYIVVEGTNGLVLRFGQFQSIKQSGVGWHVPWPFEEVEIVDVDRMRDYEHNTTMLTTDENIVDIKLATQYRIKDAPAYQFRVRDPEITLRQAVESALREAVGKSAMDFVLTEGRPEVAANTKILTQQILDLYETGIEVITINLQDSQPPREVQDAFEDAIKAREDQERYKNEAEAYSNSVLPQAQGEAATMLEQAEAYKQQIIAQAEGDASRFNQLMVEYQKAPEVTRERLYLETIEGVYSKSNKVLMNNESGNSLMYLPLDKLMSGGGGSNVQPGTSSTPTQLAPQPQNPSSVSAPLRDTTRSRGSR